MGATRGALQTTWVDCGVDGDGEGTDEISVDDDDQVPDGDGGAAGAYKGSPANAH